MHPLCKKNAFANIRAWFIHVYLFVPGLFNHYLAALTRVWGRELSEFDKWIFITRLLLGPLSAFPGKGSFLLQDHHIQPKPSLAAVAVGIADLWNPFGACDRCATCQGKPKFLFSRSEFSHRRVAFKFGVCSGSTDRRSLSLAHLWWLCGKSQLSQSLQQ